MAIGHEDIAALERILDWAHEQGIGPMGRGQHVANPSRHASGTPPDEMETPDHGVMKHADAGHDEAVEGEYEDHESRADGAPGDEEEIEHGVEEMPRASHFGSHRFGGAPSKKPMPGKRR